jgi:hypothetical protein
MNSTLSTDAPHTNSLQEKEPWLQLTEDEQRIITAKLSLNNTETAQKVFNDRLTGKNAEETAALVIAVKNLIDNAGGRSNSEVWQEIRSIDGGWVDKRNSSSAALRLSVDNSNDFLAVLRKNGYDVDRYYEVFSDHKHSARFITETSYQPGMHFVQEENYPDNKFDVHWDRRSSAFKKAYRKYYLLPAFAARCIERVIAGKTHTNPVSSAQVRQELKQMGLVPREDAPQNSQNDKKRERIFTCVFFVLLWFLWSNPQFRSDTFGFNSPSNSASIAQTWSNTTVTSRPLPT